MPHPFGGTFDASGDFDALLGAGECTLLDAIDPDAETTMFSSEMPALLAEVDALLATNPNKHAFQAQKKPLGEDSHGSGS